MKLGRQVLEHLKFKVPPPWTYTEASVLVPHWDSKIMRVHVRFSAPVKADIMIDFKIRLDDVIEGVQAPRFTVKDNSPERVTFDDIFGDLVDFPGLYGYLEAVGWMKHIDQVAEQVVRDKQRLREMADRSSNRSARRRPL